jgi:hypothetical protein
MRNRVTQLDALVMPGSQHLAAPGKHRAYWQTTFIEAFRRLRDGGLQENRLAFGEAALRHRMSPARIARE